MKKVSLIIVFAFFSFLFQTSLFAQESPKKMDSLKLANAEEGPFMFKFEPDFINQNEKRKAEIAITRSIIDTLNVSDRKRQKLLRDLYKNGISRRLQKAILVENTYEDIEQ